MDHRLGIGRAVLLALVLAIWPGVTYGQEGSGMGLTLQEVLGRPPGEPYGLGQEPIPLVLNFKVLSQYLVYTDKGTSETEFHRFLLLTNPAGRRYGPGEEGASLDPKPPLVLNERPMTPAEMLEPGWVRSVSLADIRELFPEMNTVPGWYELQVILPFVRYFWVFQDTSGIYGVIDDPDNWTGSVVSNKIRILVEPGAGAQLKVQVKEEGSPAQALSQIPVRLFGGEIPEGSLKDAWKRDKPLAQGTTDFGGMTVWKEGIVCKPQAAYTAVAYRRAQYKGAVFLPGDEGWAGGCTGGITREILFPRSLLPSASAFSVLGFSGVWVQEEARIETGHVGALEASTGPYLNGNAEMTFDKAAYGGDGVSVYGDTVTLKGGASIDNVFYNEISSQGQVRGTAVTPLAVPVDVAKPAFKTSKPRLKPVLVQKGKTLTLKPGNYGILRINPGGTLLLEGGEYHFRDVTVYSGGAILYAGVSEARIAQRFYGQGKVKIGPKEGSGVKAKDMVFYVAGANRVQDNPLSDRMSMEVGSESEISATLYAPNGTLALGEGSKAAGAFVGRWVLIRKKAQVSLESGF